MKRLSAKHVKKKKIQLRKFLSSVCLETGRALDDSILYVKVFPYLLLIHSTFSIPIV